MSARNVLLALAVTLLPATAAGAAQDAPVLDVRSLVAHPGYLTADYDRICEDWLAALEADPAHPLAADALAEMEELREVLVEPLDLDRLVALVPRVTDALTSLRLRTMILSESRRRRMTHAPHSLPGDLFADLISSWRVLGPTGPLDHPDPIMAAPDPAGPVGGPRAEHASTFGETLTWRPVERARNQLLLTPARELPQGGAGAAYLLAHVQSGASHAELELLGVGPFQVYWNGRLVLDRSARATAERELRNLVPVDLEPGWNALLLRFPSDLGARFAARLLDASGAVLEVRELDPLEPLPPPTRIEGSGPTRLAIETTPSVGTGFERALAVLRACAVDREDRALAVPAPGGREQRIAWLRARYRALQDCAHLPRETVRRGTLEVEEELERLDSLFPEVRALRVTRWIGEDKPAEALAEARTLSAIAGAIPVLRTPEILALTALDRSRVLAMGALRSLAQEHPGFSMAHSMLLTQADESGDAASAPAIARAMLAAPTAASSETRRALGVLSRGSEGSLFPQVQAIRNWIEEEPAYARPRLFLEQVMRDTGRYAELEQLLRARMAKRPQISGPRTQLSEFLVSRGRGAEALQDLEAHLARHPGDRRAREAATALGREDVAERFFRAFGPDRDEALAAARGVSGASISEALDSGMLYLFRDGASHQRFHTITVALDRKGTELLHEEQVQPDTRLARVLKKDGTVFEPVEVNGSWVMPTLAPGDAVEMVFDQYTRGMPGVAPDLGWWRFSSFEKPFVRSRYVLFVPDGLPGDLRVFHFDGTHEEHRWEGGTVHVFLAKDRARQKEEPLRPSYEEMLPWLHYGADIPLQRVADLWRGRLRMGTHVPADLQSELVQVVARLDPDLDEFGRARALYEVITTRVLEFRGTAITSHVWNLKRGNPIFLLGALYELTGVSFEWGILERTVAPELDREPKQAFANTRGFDLPVLRLKDPGPEGEVVWQVSPGDRGSRFAAIPDSIAGARVLVLGAEGVRTEELSRNQLEDSWSIDLDVTYVLDADGAARVQGQMRVTNAQGAVLREQLSQTGAAQREGAARNMVGQLVPGLDLSSFEFPGLDSRGLDFELHFEGRVPGFVRRSGGEHLVDLRLPPTGLSTGLGAAQRTWPLALRVTQRNRARVRVEVGTAWRIVGAPTVFREERAGYLHALEVESSDEGWEATRTFVLRGLGLEAEEMPGFLRRAAELEREETRPLKLEAVR